MTDIADADPYPSSSNTTPNMLVPMAELDVNYEMLGCVGRGGFGSVYHAKKRSASRREVAVKLFRMSLDDDAEEILEVFTRELEAVLHLDDDEDDDINKKTTRTQLSLVYFRDWFRGSNFAGLVMDYIPGGTLAQEIETMSIPYTERRIGYYALQLAEALAYAHAKGVYHYDVKASNILIDRRTNGAGKLIVSDFGSAVMSKPSAVMSKPSGVTSRGGERGGLSFSKQFAAPELLQAVATYQNNNNNPRDDDADDYEDTDTAGTSHHHRQQYDDVEAGLRGETIDAFALGCILFEIVCCTRMIDIPGEETIGEYVAQHGAEAVLTLRFVRLPWHRPPLPPPPGVEGGAKNHDDIEVGYSHQLRCLIAQLLEPDPEHRATPFEVIEPFKRGILTSDFCTAALDPRQGDPLTIDNIQLGKFVQRGRDWNDENADGGLGSIGIITQLDDTGDAEYTTVTFPSDSTTNTNTNTNNDTNTDITTLLCRIGAGKKYELKIGPTPMHDFFRGDPNRIISQGVMDVEDISKYYVGQKMNPNCQVVQCDAAVPNMKHRIFVAPRQKIETPTHDVVLPVTIPSTTELSRLSLRKPRPIPDQWNLDLGTLVPIEECAGGPENNLERQLVTDLFYSTDGGGMDKHTIEIVSIQAIQHLPLWTAYAKYCEEIAMDNWSNPNEGRFFHGTGTIPPEEVFLSQRDCREFYRVCATAVNTNDEGVDIHNLLDSNKIRFSSSAIFADQYAYRKYNNGARQIILSRVALGRTQQIGLSSTDGSSLSLSLSSLKYHSTTEIDAANRTILSIRRASRDEPFQHQVYPEYIVTYKEKATSLTSLPRDIRHALPSIQTDDSSRGGHPRRRLFRATGTFSNTLPARPVPLSSPTFLPNHSSAFPSMHTISAPTGAVGTHAPGTTPSLSRGRGDGPSEITTPRKSSSTTSSGEGREKLCILCLERPVNVILIPCGHASLCEHCSTWETQRQLKWKCPECRATFASTCKIYATVVE